MRRSNGLYTGKKLYRLKYFFLRLWFFSSSYWFIPCGLVLYRCIISCLVYTLAPPHNDFYQSYKSCFKFEKKKVLPRHFWSEGKRKRYLICNRLHDFLAHQVLPWTLFSSSSPAYLWFNILFRCTINKRRIFHSCFNATDSIWRSLDYYSLTL